MKTNIHNFNEWMAYVTSIQPILEESRFRAVDCSNNNFEMFYDYKKLFGIFHSIDELMNRYKCLSKRQSRRRILKRVNEKYSELEHELIMFRLKY